MRYDTIPIPVLLSPLVELIPSGIFSYLHYSLSMLYLIHRELIWVIYLNCLILFDKKIFLQEGLFVYKKTPTAKVVFDWC